MRVLFLALLAVLAIVGHAKVYANLQANCDDFGTLFRSDDGGKTLSAIVTEPSWNKWMITQDFDLGEVTKRTIIKVRCRNAGGPGGFIAQMIVNGTYYPTIQTEVDKPWQAGDWRIYFPSMKVIGMKPGDIKYIPNVRNNSWGYEPYDEAYWIDIPSHSSLDFYFRFRRLFRTSPTEEDEEEVFFDPEKEKAAILAAAGYEMAALAVSTVAHETHSGKSGTVMMVGMPLVGIIAAMVAYGACKARSKQHDAAEGEYQVLLEVND